MSDVIGSTEKKSKDAKPQHGKASSSWIVKQYSPLLASLAQSSSSSHQQHESDDKKEKEDGELLAPSLRVGKIEKNLWGYTDPRIDEEFDRFLFRDQTTLPVAIIYILGTSMFAITNTISGFKVSLLTWAYLVPMSPILLGFLILDQIAYCLTPSLSELEVDEEDYEAYQLVAKKRRNAKLWITIRKIAGAIFAYGVIHSQGWYQIHVMDECSFGFNDDPDFSAKRRRGCVEVIDPWLILPFTGILFFGVKQKLHMQLFFLSLCLLLVLFGSIPFYSSYFGSSAGSDNNHQVVIYAVYMVLSYLLAVVLAVLRWKTVQYQFEQAITVAAAHKATVEQQLLVNALLETLLPKTVLTRLLDEEVALTPRGPPLADFVPSASILFSDLVSFTKWSSIRSPDQVVSMLNSLVTEFDDAAEEVGEIERVKTIGDAYWATSGVPDTGVVDHAQRLCDLGLRMQDILTTANNNNPSWKLIMDSSSGGSGSGAGGEGISMRVGIHSGPVEGAVLGTVQVTYEVFGATNVIASQVEQNGEPGFVTITEDVLKACSKAVAENNSPSSGDNDAEGARHRVESSFVVPEVQEFPHHHAIGSEAGRGSTTTNRVIQTADGRTLELFLLVPSPSQTTATATTALSILPAPSSGAIQYHEGEVASVRSYDSRSHGVNSSSGRLSRQSSFGAKKKELSVEEQERRERRKQRFLAQQRQRRGDLVQGETEAEAWKARSAELNTRRFRFCCLGLRDREEEQGFERFTLSQTGGQRVASRIGSMISYVLMNLFLWLDGREVPGISTVSLMVAAALATIAFCVTLGLYRAKSGPFPQEYFPLLVVELVMQMLACLAATYGCWAAVPDLPSTNKDSVNIVVNRPGYVYLIGILPVGLCTHMVPYIGGALPIHTTAFFVMGLPNMFVMMSTNFPLAQIDSLMIIMATATFSFYSFISERVLRQTYSEQQLAKHLQLEREQHKRDAEDVLSTMVPSHSKGDLIRWIGSGLSNNDLISKTYSSVCIAFLLLKKEKDGTELKETTSSTNDDDSSAKKRRSSSWLQKAHAAVDGELIQYSNLLTKIKTIGEIVMIAGPFASAEAHTEDGTETPSTAHALLKAITNIRDRVGIPCVAGLHCGSVMTAILGTSRPTFDVFGDAVNTASRVMTTSKQILLNMQAQARLRIGSDSNGTTITTTHHGGDGSENQSSREDGEFPSHRLGDAQYASYAYAFDSVTEIPTIDGGDGGLGSATTGAEKNAAQDGRSDPLPKADATNDAPSRDSSAIYASVEFLSQLSEGRTVHGKKRGGNPLEVSSDLQSLSDGGAWEDKAAARGEELSDSGEQESDDAGGTRPPSTAHSSNVSSSRLHTAFTTTTTIPHWDNDTIAGFKLGELEERDVKGKDQKLRVRRILGLVTESQM